MKKVLSGIVLLGIVAAPALAVPTNQGPDRPLPDADSVIGDDLGGGPAMLYGPSEADDAAWRANLAAAIGGTCDYFDASGSVPSLDFLMGYDCVHVWANFAFADPDAYGDNLARFVDGGGAVIMGAFTVYTSGNSLGGDVVTPAYCPVVGGSNNFFYATYAGDGTSCITTDAAGAGGTYRDILSTQGAGVVNGTFTDGEVFVAYNTDFAPRVVYANGSGGFPIDGNDPGQVAAVGAACTCTGGGVPVEETTWGAIKGQF
jgi:hypothetical protein